MEPVGLTPHGPIFALSLQEQASCLLLPSRLRSLSPPSMAAYLRYRSALSSGAESTTRTPEASLLLASGVPPSFASAAIHGGFSSLSLGTLYGMRVLRLAPSSSKPPACFLRDRLRSLPPPSMAAFPRYCSALSSGGESTTHLPPTALPKCSRSPATLRFCRLVSEKNHQKSPRSLKVRQTPCLPLHGMLDAFLKLTYRTKNPEDL